MSDADRDFAPVFAVLQTQLKARRRHHYLEPLHRRGAPPGCHELAHWIERYVHGGRKSPLGTLIEQAYVNEYGREADAAKLAQPCVHAGLSTDGYPADHELNVLGYSDQRYFIDGGNQQLPEAIAAALPAGSVLKRTPAHLDQESRRRLRRSRSRAPPVASARRYDRVVLAIPFTTLRDVDWSSAGFDARKTTGDREARLRHAHETARAISRAVLGSQTDLGRAPPRARSGRTCRFQNSIDFSLGQNGASGLIERFTGGYASLRGVPGEAVRLLVAIRASARGRRRLSRATRTVSGPGVSKHYNGKATFGNAQADPNALGTYSCWLTGQYTTIAGYEGVRQGNVFFAGEHCSVDYQGFMEGAARTGVSAAREIVSDYGVKK